MNSKNILKMAAAGAVVLTAASCSHDKLDLYSGPKAIVYMQQVATSDAYGNPRSYTNSRTVSFASVDEKYQSTTTSFYVNAGGEVVDYDRPYVLRVEADSTTAIEGEDFDMSLNDFIIKAGTSRDTVRVKLLRSEKLQKKQYRIGFHLEPNENFNTDIAAYKNSAGWNIDGPMIDATRFYVYTSEIYSCPSYWESFGDSFFGVFSAKKFRLVNSLMGWKASDWNYAGFSGYPVQYGRFSFAAGMLQKHLQKMADEGTPVREEDGSFMLAGAGYPVNYSKYSE